MGVHPYVVLHSAGVPHADQHATVLVPGRACSRCPYRVVAYDVGRVEADAPSAAARYQLKGHGTRSAGHAGIGPSDVHHRSVGGNPR